MVSPLIQQVLEQLKARQAARGQATEDSDVDVAVVVDDLSPTEWKAVQSDAADVGVANELPLSVLAMSSDRFEHLRQTGGISTEILRDGLLA